MIGGGELAAMFLRSYEAAEPMEILSREAGFVVRAEAKRSLAMIDDAPGVVPKLPAQRPRNGKALQKQRMSVP